MIYSAWGLARDKYNRNVVTALLDFSKKEIKCKRNYREECCTCCPPLTQGINFWLCWVFVATQTFSLVVTSRGYSLVVVHQLSLLWLLLLQRWSLGTWASVAVACELSSCGSQALGHGLSSCSTCH